MKKIIKTICSSLFLLSIITNAQTLTATQQQNARATGYAIVAAKNPGKSFSVYMIKWDGIHDLEYNANTQINNGWHPQAAIKGNYFDQAFVANDFSTYSSVVVSQAEFDTYKSTGSDWWIVCSYLPSFSNSSVSLSDNGNLGIGTVNPQQKFVVSNNGAEGFELYLNQPSSIIGLQSYNRTLNAYSKMQLDASQFSFMYGNVGIGTLSPDEKLTVKGKIHTQEVRVDMAGPLVPDYVFAEDYNLKSLEEVENYIKENKHLPEIPSAHEIEQNGLMMAEMNMSLLKKVEELTLYMIEQQKENKEQTTEINALKKENQVIKLILERVSKLENQLQN